MTGAQLAGRPCCKALTGLNEGLSDDNLLISEPQHCMFYHLVKKTVVFSNEWYILTLFNLKLRTGNKDMTVILIRNWCGILNLIWAYELLVYNKYKWLPPNKNKSWLWFSWCTVHYGNNILYFTPTQMTIYSRFLVKTQKIMAVSCEEDSWGNDVFLLCGANTFPFHLIEQVSDYMSYEHHVRLCQV